MRHLIFILLILIKDSNPRPRVGATAIRSIPSVGNSSDDEDEIMAGITGTGRRMSTLA
jgi:hypothetical protein